MLVLIVLTFFIFLILWLGDFYLTKKVIRKKGIGLELNPLMKIYAFRGRFVYLFKALEIGIFFYLIYFLTTVSNSMTPFYILLVYIFLYSVLVSNNSWIYFKAFKRPSKALNYIFMAVAIVLILFLYLSFVEYETLTASYSQLLKCKFGYKDLEVKCEKNITYIAVDTPEFSDLKSIVDTIDIPIPKP